MNCAEFRRRVDTEPLSQDPALEQHRVGCAACALYLQHAQGFEQRLHQVVNIEPPAQFADDILGHVHAQPAQMRHSRRFTGLALAASLALALLVAVGAWRYHDQHTLAAYAVAHVPGAEAASLTLTESISASAIKSGFSARDVPLQGPIPANVTYIHDCIVGPYRAVHVVMRVAGQPVTMLYLPSVDDAPRQRFTRNGLHGRQLPTAQGSMVLLAETTASFDAVETAWRTAIDGPTRSAFGSR